MMRIVAGGVAALSILAGTALWWNGTAHGDPVSPPPPPSPGMAASASEEPLAAPPAASERTREQKRFDRIDRDKNGRIAREEFLYARRRAFDRIDVNHDGRLSFEEYAAKAIDKFARADADHSGALVPAEFATTRVVRRTRPQPNCACPDPAANARDED